VIQEIDPWEEGFALLHATLNAYIARSNAAVSPSDDVLAQWARDSSSAYEARKARFDEIEAIVKARANR
jgi:hypothetical protein